MKDRPVDISAIMTCHHEGTLTGPSLRSFEEAIESARAAGSTVESIIVLDNPDEGTLHQFDGAERRGHRVVLGDCGDPGGTRNLGVASANGEWVAFLDGDDLWSYNWLSAAHAFGKKADAPVIAHCEIQVLFGMQQGIIIHADSEGPDFNSQALRAANYWDALCFAPRHVLLTHPYRKNDVRSGFGHEDWHWNCVTLADGIAHRPVPDTVHFKRRRARSQLSLCADNDVVIWPNPVSSFEWTMAVKPA
jgi:glycosyltransferase involved in cell wall biosynthesis